MDFDFISHYILYHKEMNLIVFFDNVLAAVLSTSVFIILMQYASRSKKYTEKRYFVFLVIIGIVIPAIHGIVTQVVLPELFHSPYISLSSTMMVVFFIAIIIVLDKYKSRYLSVNRNTEMVLDNNHDILLIVSVDGKLTYINPAGIKMLGINKKNIGAYSIDSLFFARDGSYGAEKFKTDMLDKLLPGDRIEEHAAFIQPINKEKIPVFIYAGIIPNKDKKEILVLARMVVKEEKKEELLKRQKKLYENLLRAQSEMGEGISITEEGRFLYVNDILCSIYGYSREELMAMPSFFDIVVPEQRSLLSKQLMERQKGSYNMWNYGETTIIHKHGNLVHISYSIQIVHQGKQRQIFSIIRDITEQKKTEQKLSNQVLMLKSIIEGITEGLIVTDEKLNFIYFNSLAEKTFDINFTSNNLKEWCKTHRIFLPDTLTPFHQDEYPFVKAIRGEETVGLKAFIQNCKIPKGTFVSINSKPIKNEANNIIGVIVTFQDITERKKVENSIKQSQALLSIAQQLTNIGSWEWDIITDKVYWSDELYKIHGIKPNEASISYQEFIKRVHVADRKLMEAKIQESLKTLKPFKFYHRITRPDKSVRMLYAKGEVVIDKEGQVVKVVGTGQDMTEQLHEEEMEKLAIAATQSFNSVVIADKEGEIEWVNEGFTNLTGYVLEDVKGTHGELLRKGDATGLSKDTDFYESIIKEKKPVTYESKNYTKSGDEYYVITTLTPIINKDGEVERIIAIDSDITLRKEMEESIMRANKIAEHSLKKGSRAIDELTKAKKQLEESMRIKERFLANMSHEIRTPMNAIIGMSDILQDSELSSEKRECINAIKTSADNLLSIINDILDFSKIESGKIVFENVPLRIGEVMKGIMQTLYHEAEKKNINIKYTLSESIPQLVTGDPARLRQVLLNLVGNSIKFTEKGGIEISVELKERRENDYLVLFTVEDTGIGIPEDKLSSIFESFNQASNDTSRKYGGTGLGLTIVKQLVELQGGTIYVESKINEGSRFFFTLSFQRCESADKMVENEEKKISFSKLTDVKILLVEDNTLNQMLAQKVLSKWGILIDIASDGKIAIDKLSKEDYDIILMDIQMPEMDGYSATQYIRKIMLPPKSQVPIIAMTAHAIVGEAEKCIALGMNDYISKPFKKETLYDKISKLVKKEK